MPRSWSIAWTPGVLPRGRGRQREEANDVWRKQVDGQEMHPRYAFPEGRDSDGGRSSRAGRNSGETRTERRRDGSAKEGRDREMTRGSRPIGTATGSTHLLDNGLGKGLTHDGRSGRAAAMATGARSRRLGSVEKGEGGVCWSSRRGGGRVLRLSEEGGC